MSSVASRIRSGDLSHDAGREKIDLVDFKMVTFSLAGKDYGIDIMKVKEIARFVNFTYVPNTPSFVRGVYNLRGEIISIIDLRAMFNLPFQQKATNEEEPGLILRLDNNLIGVVVDRIDKVVGISSSSIQPPHPIFGDINIKYISGVVENDGRLYIILDAERVLGKQEDKADEAVAEYSVSARQNLIAESAPALSRPSPEPTPETSAAQPAGRSAEDEQNKNFVAESLMALTEFNKTPVNETWFDSRYKDWTATRKGQQVQVRTMEEAKSFLESFPSPFSGQLWGPDYLKSFADSLPEFKGNIYQVWNPGCGRGYETYSIAVALRMRYPEAQIKIWASDKDLLAISGAPNLVFPEREIHEIYKPYMTEGKNGLSFSPRIKDMILFEYHDISNNHGLPPLDLVIARDVISFMSSELQKRVFEEINGLMKRGGCLILGKNEVPPNNGNWELEEHQHMHIGRKS